MRARLVIGLLLALCTHAASASADTAERQLPPSLTPPYRPPTPPDTSYSYASPGNYPSLAWTVLQLLPSPEVGGGSVRRTGIDGVQHDVAEAAFGMRWQLTPIAWSWGTNRRISRWRTFVVDPIARNSGSLELNGTFEYFFGHVDRMLVRPGVRATFPLLHRGEYLSASIGTSVYTYNGVPRVAYDVGAYVFFGLFGVQLTVAPGNLPLSYIGTFRIRYF